MSSGILKTNDWLLKDPPVLATGPAFRGKFAGVGETDDISTKKFTDVLDAFLYRGTYPTFLANETTFSRKVAESMKTSFDIMFAL